ncbi:transposable element Tcb2 transposase [Trichonephila clavipes]|nr:transposable element Tcb2 transposase [Trichonephila clavipes]
MDVCKCIVHSWHGGTLNSRGDTSPLVILVEGEDKRKASDHPRHLHPQNWGETQQNCTVTCMVLKAKANNWQDRYIVLSAKRNRRTTAQEVTNQFLAASGKQISRKTVARRLRGGGLYARRPVVCVPLTRQHHTARLQWCREHHNWTEQDWACVLFSDESRFSLSSDCRRQLIWRESGTAYRPENIQEKNRYPTCSIMVWAGIMINGRTRLHVVANGTMTGQRYIDEVLLPHVRLFRGAVGDKFLFMDDNATCHRTLAVRIV